MRLYLLPCGTLCRMKQAERPPIDRPIAFLRYLHQRRFCDREIALYLNDPPLYLLHLHPHTSSALCLLDAPPPAITWTRRMVQWTRNKLGLRGHRKPRRELKNAAQACGYSRHIYALRWATLGLDLYPAQVDILDALLEHGPQTMGEMMARHGWTRPPTLHGTKSAIASLIESRVVVLLGSAVYNGKVVRQYGLADGVKPAHDRRRLTGVEQRLKAMGLIEDQSGSLPYPTSATYSSAERDISCSEGN